MTDGEAGSDADAGREDGSETDRGTGRPNADSAKPADQREDADEGSEEATEGPEQTADRDTPGRSASESVDNRSTREASGPADPDTPAGEGVPAEAEGTAEDESAVGGDPTPATEPTVEPEGIDVESLTGPVRRLDPRVRYVWVLGSVIGSLMLGAIAGVVGFFVLNSLLVGPAAFLFLFALGAVLAVLRYRSWAYEVREDSLYLKRGVLTHTRTVVPYVRIQHVDASRGPVERTLGLATVVVYTAGSRGADVSIPGLTTDRADDLQERLKRLAIAAEGEDAV